jgi:CheY-like chemotaxis protein
MTTILVVDDNTAVARMMARLLQARGYRALVASDGPGAISVAHDESPNLILLDMMMPDMDGLEVLRRLKSDPQTSPVPVILFSAVDDPKVVAAAMREGAQEYWVKASFHFEDLPLRLARHLDPPTPQNDA